MTLLASQSNAVNIIVPIVVIVMGLLNCFFGYRLMRFWVGIMGFVAGYLICFLILSQFSLNTWVVSLVPLIPGILLIFIAYQIYEVGIFILCATLTFCYSYGLVDRFPKAKVYIIIGGVILAVILGLLAVKFMKPAIIFTTALSGAGNIIAQLMKWIDYDNHVVILIAAIVLGILGMVVQAITTKDYNVDKKKIHKSA
ncbi:MAG: DUF4203 domain-containing protein [Lachnospiraceae bacterium]|nr:DUF4203 domain-containing protein [Lachnospiraceae bacterium]